MKDKKLKDSPLQKKRRGLFLMLTFCVFAATAFFSLYGVAQYGTELITDSREAYMSSESYQRELGNEVEQLLQDVWDIQSSSGAETLRIINGRTGEIVYYDLGEMLRAASKGEQWEDVTKDLEDYRIGSEQCKYDLESFDGVCDYLDSIEDGEPGYLYFSKSGFQDIFQRKGRRNTDYRFSDAFPETAYFIFDFKSVEFRNQMTVLSTIYSRSDDGVGLVQMLAEQTGYGGEEGIVFTLRGASDIITQMAVFDLDRYDLSRVNFAVYDPDENLYYDSVDDSYFAPADTYIYDITELRSQLARISGENTGSLIGGRYNSILLPLLRMENINPKHIGTSLTERFDNIADAIIRIGKKKDSCLRYHISNPDFTYSNVGDVSEITGLKSCYRMKGSRVNIYNRMLELQNVEELAGYSRIPEQFNKYPQNTIFYFGVDPENITANSSEFDAKYARYQIFSEGIPIAFIVIGICFILLVYQAVHMIRATGWEDNTEGVVLNRFDRLPAEGWWLITIIILCGLTAFARKIIRDTIFLSDLEVPYLIFRMVMGILPLAVLSMTLVLSFARRCKAHNMWSSSLLLKNISNHSLWKNITHLKGTSKLLLAFIGYILVQMWYLYLTAEIRSFTLPVFFLIHGVALVVVVLIIRDVNKLTSGVKEITKGNLEYKIKIREKFSPFNELVDGINHIGDGLKAAVETSLKDERMKTELITNVSHDLKTPLTSIINYINLLKAEKMPTPEAEHYVEVLDGKALRLKQLTEDLVEAAKASSGNIELEKMPLAFDELMKQAFGEFEDKFEKKGLILIANYPKEPVMVLADGRRMFRILENILQNAYKYALEKTRIYADLSKENGEVCFTLKNISAAALNISPEELMERFTRGDSARSTEGSGLGLSIAKDLTKLQGGTFDVKLDGDLFKVILTFPELKTEENQ